MEVYLNVCFKDDGEAERAMQNEYGSPILGLGMAYFMTGHREPICRIFSLDARNISARKSGSTFKELKKQRESHKCINTTGENGTTETNGDVGTYFMQIARPR